MQSIRSLTLGVLVFGAASVMGAQSAQRPAPETRQGDVRGERGGRPKHPLFEGIQLTDAEKASLKAVREKYQPQLRAIRVSLEPQLQAMRAARQRGDTTAARVAFEKTASDRARMRSIMEQSRADMRAALTPEHQRQFDQNVVHVK